MYLKSSRAFSLPIIIWEALIVTSYSVCFFASIDFALAAISLDLNADDHRAVAKNQGHYHLH